MRTGAKYEQMIGNTKVSFFEINGEYCAYGGEVIRALGLGQKNDAHYTRRIKKGLKEGEDYYLKTFGGKFERPYLTKKGVDHLAELGGAEDKPEVAEIKKAIDDGPKRTQRFTIQKDDSYFIDLLEDIDRRLQDIENIVETVDATQDLMIKMFCAYQAELKITNCQGFSVLCEAIAGLPFQKSKEIKAMLQSLSVQYHKEAKRSAKFMDKIEKDGALDGLFDTEEEKGNTDGRSDQNVSKGKRDRKR